MDMEKELLEFIGKNGLSPFSKYKSQIKSEDSVKVKSFGDESIFRTRDAKSIHNRLISVISKNFVFAETSNLWNCFFFTSDSGEIKKRQEFFKTLEIRSKVFLQELKFPKPFWKPKYGIIVVTEDEKTLMKLKELNVPVQFLISENDISELEGYDIVQVIDCEDYYPLLERLPQSVFLDSLDEVYLERYVEMLSGWKHNLEILQQNKTNEQINEIVCEIAPLLKLTSNKQLENLTRERVEQKLGDINDEISGRIKQLSISGDTLFSMLSDGKMPEELKKLVRDAIKNSEIPENMYTNSIPVKIDEEELERVMKQQNADEFTGLAENIKKYADSLVKIPEKLKKLNSLLVYFDFTSGIAELNYEKKADIVHSNEMHFQDARNLFLDKAQPVSFILNEQHKCSILTGANSGGKTTLLEHILQLVSLSQIGLPVSSEIKIPLFSDVYYFAKNKGSVNKGAFETLLTQMSKIKPGERTLILADEIESVTEPKVAGKIISATAEYFLQKGCYLVIATHLGHEIQKVLPNFARIDGIEAKGLDEKFELIVDHNPVLGRLANSTPELIVEKMANSEKTEYFEFLNKKISEGKNR